MVPENDTPEGLNGDHTLREGDEWASPPALITVPQTPDKFLPPRPKDLTALLADVCRNAQYWPRIKDIFEAEAGLRPYKHGRREFHWAETCFEIKKIAAENGHPVLDDIECNMIYLKLRRAYPRIAGATMKQLSSQRKRLQIEHRTTMAAE
jgi:hypothetical protein